MAQAKPVIAIMYDFDKTLSPMNMQEYGFIPSLGMTTAAFWQEANDLAKTQKMDGILAYMYLMIKKAHAQSVPIRRETFVALGSDLTYFDGVAQWFTRVSAYAQKAGAQVEHYIISSGLKEIIEGSSIAKYFKQIFASEFLYDVNGVAVWPKSAVNYTEKTQFLFRINKGILDVSDNDSLNSYVHEDERPIPFRNMLYIGDGLTDVPCMKLVKSNAGKSIAVYPPGNKVTKEKVTKLLRENRIDYMFGADYSQGSELDKTVELIIQEMALADELIREHREQRKAIGKIAPS